MNQTDNAPNIIHFIRRETGTHRLDLVLIGVLSGICTAFILATINAGAEAVNQGAEHFRFFLIFLVSTALFFYTKRYVMAHSSHVFEIAINDVRKRLTDKLRHANLRSLERMGQSELYSCITKETTTISQAAPLITDAALAGAWGLFSLIYIFFLSKSVFLLTAIMTCVGASVYLIKQKEVNDAIHRSTQMEIELFDGLTQVFSGFKEIKLNHAKNDGLMDHIGNISDRTRDLKIETSLATIFYSLFFQIVFYLLLATIVFILPGFSPVYTDVILMVIPAITFVVGPLSQLASSIVLYSNVNVAVQNIYKLEAELEEMDERHQGVRFDAAPAFHTFGRIQFDRVTFSYTDHAGQPGFSVGPIDLTLNINETVFVTGGNGSGKSTFVKLLAGLYFPESGMIRVDDQPLDRTRYAAYRTLFGGIWADFHLFDRLYGLSDLDEAKLNEWLRIMQLDQKTALADGRFTNLDLSTGQRKRLGLVAVLMEDRPIYILDEWTADQDAEFRRYFYEVILGELKDQGKTVIAISHDDRYFHIADRIIKMDYGQVVEA